MNRTIAFLCHPYHRGGVTSWMADAAKEASRLGYTSYFITVKPQSPFISAGARPSMVELLKNASIKIIAPTVSYEFELGTEEYKTFIYRSSIINELPKGTPIIISDDKVIWKSASSVANEYPIIGVLHSDDQVYYDLAFQFQKYISSFTAVSGRIIKHLQKLNFEGINNISVIPCGIDMSNFSSYDNSFEEQINIVWVGRVEEYQKRISDIPKIASCLKLKGINFNITILGHGSDSNFLTHEIEKNQLQNYVKIHGWVDSKTLTKFYSNADILLQTSNFEGMSVAVMEALASGCGVVSTRVSGVEDYETLPLAKDCLKLYTIGNVEEAVDRILEVSTIPKSIRKIASNNLAVQEFSIESCIKKYLHTIKDIQPSTTTQKIQNTFFVKTKSYIISTLRFIKYQLTLQKYTL